ncbi:MAG: hypothetical protein COS94_03435 [Candidatus Hydrogenedentes bacterium CG07_land_8_20_14_0_80_42_17]|nr:MAG: hypothetical protein COS94_03435 [Candidatus Hydrogenedentes bacterium CG07_land_8_20_14_0_80_42_17]
MTEKIFASVDNEKTIIPDDNWYGFKKIPFHVTPDSQMVFNHRRYEEAFSALQYGIFQGKGFIVITGEVGAGKTTLVRHFLSMIGDSLRCAVIFNTGLEPRELLCAIAEDLGIEKDRIAGAGIKEIIDAVNAVLLEEFERGRMVAVFIDEAQNLSIESLETLRMLSNLETETEKLLQIILIGQPELQKTIAKKELRQLRSRVAVTYHLMPMDCEETFAYIKHRIELAEPDRKVEFTRASTELVYKYSGGIPRVINIVADQALLIGADIQSETIDKDIVETVIEGFAHLDSPPDSSGRISIMRIVIVFIAFCVLLFGIFRAVNLKKVEKNIDASVNNEERAEIISPLRKLLTHYNITASKDFDAMKLSAIASTTGLKLFNVKLSSASIERLRLPALLIPGNAILSNSEPALITDIKNGVWKIESLERGELSLEISMQNVEVSYLVPDRPYFARILRRGMRGEDILSVQKNLFKEKLLLNEPNGYFGNGTVEAVRKLQREFFLREDGVIGPETMLAIFKVSFEKKK